MLLVPPAIQCQQALLGIRPWLRRTRHNGPQKSSSEGSSSRRSPSLKTIQPCMQQHKVQQLHVSGPDTCSLLAILRFRRTRYFRHTCIYVYTMYLLCHIPTPSLTVHFFPVSSFLIRYHSSNRPSTIEAKRPSGRHLFFFFMEYQRKLSEAKQACWKRGKATNTTAQLRRRTKHPKTYLMLASVKKKHVCRQCRQPQSLSKSLGKLTFKDTRPLREERQSQAVQVPRQRHTSV